MIYQFIRIGSLDNFENERFSFHHSDKIERGHLVTLLNGWGFKKENFKEIL